jgi:hypothetical protein
VVQYQCDSWLFARTVIAKCECHEGGTNRRFVVTSRTNVSGAEDGQREYGAASGVNSVHRILLKNPQIGRNHPRYLRANADQMDINRGFSAESTSCGRAQVGQSLRRRKGGGHTRYRSIYFKHLYSRHGFRPLIAQDTIFSKISREKS